MSDGRASSFGSSQNSQQAPSATRGGASARSPRPRRGKGASDSVLGRYTKSTSNPSQTALFSTRDRRYRLQNTAGELAQEVLPRLQNCGKFRHKKALNVSIIQGDNGAFFGGVQHCGSVHACPVCSARIANERRHEAVHALASHRAAGGVVSMMTLTLPHHIEQPLKEVLGMLRKCANALNSGRNSMKNLLESFGYLGQIRAQEVTHGQNGWHPHLHVLVFTDYPVPEIVQDVLKARWEAAAIRNGWAPPGWAVGMTWQDGRHAAEYLNKQGTWGMAEEITMQASKKGGNGGRGPFELLQDAALGEVEACELFAEYVEATRGTRQQFWSQGLKEHFGLKDVSDEEIVNPEDSEDPAPQESVTLATVDPYYWRLVIRYEQRAEVLRAAECGGQMAVDFLCTLLEEKRQRKMISDISAQRGKA